MKKNILIILSILVLALAGCGAGNTNSDNSGGDSSAGGLLSNIGGPTFYSDEDVEDLESCELLSPEMVMEYAAGVSESDLSPFDMFGCSYSWDKSNIEEIEQRNSEGFTNFDGTILEWAMIAESTENIVALSYVDFFLPQTEQAVDTSFRSLTNRQTQEETDAARQALDNAIESLGSGDETDQQISDTAEDLGLNNEGTQQILEDGFDEDQEAIAGGLLDAVTATNSEDVYVDIDGLGDRAAWSEFSKNLVVQYNNFIFELNVDIEGDNKAAAEDLAEQILEKLEKEL